MLKGWDRQYGIRRSDGSAGARNNRIRITGTLLNGKLTPLGVPRTPALFFEKDGAGIRELIEQIAGYHYEKRETLTVEEMRVVRKDDDRVAALEYAIEALETVAGPVPRYAVMGGSQHRTYGNLRARGA